MIDLKRFHNNLSPELRKLFRFFVDENFRPGVVGGIPRDYINEAAMGKDFDVELRPVDEDNFKDRFLELPTKLKDLGYVLEEKGYDIWEIKLGDLSVEFGLPRIEIFNGKVHHSNFDAKHIPDQDYSQGFKRRDFTVNAIMFEYNGSEWRVVDPLEGVKDLRSRNLKACDNQNFVKDPVRFLRAVRFKTKLGLQYDLSLLTLIKNMELSISTHYLKMEAQKSLRPLTFLLECSNLRESVFTFSKIGQYPFEIEEYEDAFELESLKEHISFALFLPAKLRESILTSFGMSPKGQLDIALKEINFGKVKSLSVSQLSKLSWVSPFLSFITRAGEIGDKRVSWLLDYAGLEVDFHFIQSYNDLTIAPDSNTPNELKRFDVFQKKINKLI